MVKEESPLMKRLRKTGLLGCFDGTGVTSENYKQVLGEFFREELTKEAEEMGLYDIGQNDRKDTTT